MDADPSLFRCLGWNTQGDIGPFTFYTSKRKGLIFFLKAPPKELPSEWQIHQRNKWKAAAAAWAATPPLLRKKWQLAADRCHLAATGYNLWIYWQTTGDRAAIATIERHSRLTLLPP